MHIDTKEITTNFSHIYNIVTNKKVRVQNNSYGKKLLLRDLRGRKGEKEMIKIASLEELLYKTSL